jgi:hypothetical protein
MKASPVEKAYFAVKAFCPVAGQSWFDLEFI